MEQGAAVVVTKRSLLCLAALASVMIYSGCGVELSQTTPGAVQPCEPDTQQLTDADAIMTSYLQERATTFPSGRQHCGSCHVTATGNTAASSFGIFEGSTPEVKKANWCSAFERAETLTSNYLLSTHPGGVYSAAEVQQIQDWAASIIE